ERTLISANQIMNERDAGLRSTFKDVELNSIRDCCFVLIGLLTGMRCDEILGIRKNAGRSETKDGFTYHWIASIEHKTKKGAVEYLVSAMGLDVLSVVERWAEPHHARVEQEIKELLNRSDKLSALENSRLGHLQEIKHRIFMSASDSNSLSGRVWGKKLQRIARSCGSGWKLAPHQFRRTYARTFVQHRLGNLLFLKNQFKHSTLDMSQLYAANRMQDETLYDECLAELFKYKVETIGSWMSEDTPLAGGAGKKIVAMRGHAFPDRKALIRETASKVTIRSTGHSWCLSQDAEGCGGQGLYERPRCAPCGNSVIDRRFEPVWRELFVHQTELQQVALELGPAAQQRVERDLTRARQVLSDLGNGSF
ncbi:site-specific integrase, partial [Aquabacterium sp.]|uniref:site-specific integrase n=1 Tax=Aquabacterium sp. TaxID=1872578 RepID=UPI0025BC493B